MIDYDKLHRALKPLELQYANHKQAQSRPELTEIDREAIAESVIQRFETCYDTLWKDLKRYLIEEIGLPMSPTVQSHSGSWPVKITSSPRRSRSG